MMGEWVEQKWCPSDAPALPRRSRKAGRYLAYVPDRLDSPTPPVSRAVATRAAELESRIVELTGRHPGATRGIEGVSRFLLRSEALASSKIEGMTPGPDEVAIAELVGRDNVGGFSRTAALVANNVAVLRGLGAGDPARPLTVADIVDMHARLLDHERLTGLRTVQNWIGGSDRHPIDAAYVPPPPSEVPDLMQDLVDYLNSSIHGPLLQAGIVHAQFETIHPFVDGNGRIGRALIHEALHRRHLLPVAMLPVSMVLGTWSREYIAGLTAYRDDGLPDRVDRWLSVFLDAVAGALDQVERLGGELAELRGDWRDRIRRDRLARGLPAQPRADAVDLRILDGLPDLPVLTAAVVAEEYGVSATAARGGLDRLADAGILRSRSVGKGIRGYFADELLDLIIIAERRVASTRFGTAVAPPRRGVPVHPDRR